VESSFSHSASKEVNFCYGSGKPETACGMIGLAFGVIDLAVVGLAADSQGLVQTG
jgi:hypothetical protein